MSCVYENEELGKLIEELNKAISAEALAWYQYLAGSLYVEGIFRYGIEQEFKEHAEDEYEHLKQLMEHVHILGGEPVAHPKMWFDLSECEFRAPIKKNTLMLVKHNIDAEDCAIQHYAQIADFARQIGQHSTYNLISQILQKEEEHKRELQMFLDDYKRFVSKQLKI